LRVLYQAGTARPAAALALAGGGVLLGGAWIVYSTFAGLPGAAQLRTIGRTPQATVVYDRSGRPFSTLFREQRLDVPLDRIAQSLRQAIVATEDRRFFEHDGVDVRRILGAAWYNLREGRMAQGASTITQQLARQRFLSRDKTLRRKIREATVARRLERLYSKSEILELYLNEVYFGDGLYGAEAAARGYFGKTAEEIDLAEAALLAGLVKAPSIYSPTVDLERAETRRNLVLRVMRDTGVIDAEQERTASQAPIVLRDGLGRRPAGEYFVEEVRQTLVERFGVARVYESGLRVYTTIDPAMQFEAEATVARALADIEARDGFRTRPVGRRSAKTDDDRAEPDPLQAALVAVDPRSGEVRALVGGRDFLASPFNRAVQARRQPGSAFKPFVFAAALEAGYSPASLIDHLDEPIETTQGPWLPDDGHVTATAMTVRAALRQSSNRAAAHVLQAVGIPETASYVERLGLGPVPAVPSMALGSGEVSLLSMTMAYAAFADRGLARSPVLIRRVTDAGGTVLFEAAPRARRALAETTAFLMADMLADVIDAGTASIVRRLGFTRPAGGKTGTTNGFADAWFIGFTPDLVAGVWVGFDRPRTIAGNGYASDLAVPMWTRFMQAATRPDSPSWFVPPAGIVTARICELSGLLASDGCRRAHVVDEHGNLVERDLERLEYFVDGTQPIEVCGLHARASFFARVARAFGADPPRPFEGHGPEPLPAELTQPAGSDDVAGALDATSDAADGGKRRGFWGRLFGRGR